MNAMILTTLCLLIPAAEDVAPTSSQAELVSVQKIWNAAPHSAFTDLIRFHNAWYCTFREAEDHVGSDGQIRVITSNDAKTWESVALFEEDGIDLRDPKICITPDDRLMVVMGGSVYEGKELVGRQPRVTFSSDGQNWGPLQRVLSDGHWLWRVTWHDGTAYGVSYLTTRAGEDDWGLVLVSSADGVNYTEVTKLEIPGRPNETTLRFTPSGEMIALVRREADSKNAWIGTSKAPYTEWTWNETSERLGGPDFIILPNGAMWAGGRHYLEGGARTMLTKMTLDSLTPVLDLPSGGDTSYPGFVWHDGLLWMTYYASHEDKTSIYLARIRINDAVDE
ncbi:MAG: exo-alpha-sialidase [Candidatus Hydrogenedentes bacterium]|nr:exo-alpha-sialidase [Candidatus Hydrogenedentota bacterium]